MTPKRPFEFIMAGALLSVALATPAQAQDEPADPPLDKSASTSSDGVAPESAQSPLSAVAVRVTLANTELQEEAILQALANEFSAPVVKADGPRGLFLAIDGRTLQASYRDEEDQVIERTLELPRDQARQLDTIALLSGNLARDEAGELLAELRAESAEDATLPAEPEESAPVPAEEPEQGEPSPAEEAETKEESEPPQKVEEKPAKEPSSQQEERPALPVADLSVSLWGKVTWPSDLDKKKSHVHLGAVHSEIGSLEGFAGNLFIMKNLGAGAQYAGQGAQVSTIWTHSGGKFEGFSGSAIAATGEGGIDGVQAASIFTFQKNETQGGQLAGVASVSMSHIEGGQGAGAFVGTWGDIEGVQGAGVVAITSGDLEGVQLAGAASVVGGTMDGFQLGATTWAQDLDGFQLGAFNVAHQSMDGFQLGAGNYAGDFEGTQIGLLNIGGEVNGAQIGLINVAKDVDGVAFAPVNIIPGIRNQIVTYGSWAPVTSSEAAPAGPLIHLGMKFMPDPIYTQLSLGLGAEAASCPSGLLPGDAGCAGNGIIYAPGFAFGGRGMITGGLFTEIDLQYQFEKAFGSSQAHRHAVLGRAALGYEFDEKFAIFVGGGPRMDARVGADGKLDPLVSWNPHVFGGIQVF